MKVLMVNDFKYEIGGAEVYMLTLKKYLEKQGHTVKIFTSDQTKDEYIQKLQYRTLKDYFQRIFNVSSLRKFKEQYKKYKPDIIHIHGFFNVLSPSFLADVGTTPCVMTVHDDRIAAAVSNQEIRNGKKCAIPLCPGCLNCVGWKGMMFEKIRQFVQSLLLYKIKLFIVPSKSLYNKLEKYTSIRPLHQLYNGFELPQAKPLNKTNTITFIGRLAQDKGVLFLIQAMPAILKAYPNTKLTIIGNGDEEETIKKEVENLKLQKNVTLMEAVPHNNIENYLYKTDIICVPSLNDNLPTICIEAMASGRVVVASKVGGLPELIEDNHSGLLCEPESPVSISKAIIQVFSKPALKEKLAKNAIVKGNNFNIDIHIKNIIDIYTSYCELEKRT